MPVANIYLSFIAVGFHSGFKQGFDAMVGDNPPTITGGYAKWANIARPLQRALTIPQGYDPTTMTVEVRFGRWGETNTLDIGAWQIDDTHGQQVEQDIGVLEWMAGSNFRQGPSPAVYVASHGSQGRDTNLIPPQYAGVPWVITGLQWGKSWRNPNGFRVWQEATITLQNYLNLSAPPRPDTNVRGGYFISRPGVDTPLKIAAAPSAHSPIVAHRILAGRICADAKNNPMKGTSIHLSGKSLSFKIRHGVACWVPQHQGN